MTELNIDINNGQAAKNIENHFHAQACPGQEACPYERGEAERQRRFEERTGIVCSSGARQVLEHLLDSGVFHYKQIALAWRQKTLWWDWDKHVLNAAVSRLDLAYGHFLMWGGLATFLLAFFGLAWFRRNDPLNAEIIQIMVGACLFLTAAPFAEKYLVRPSRIARRAKPLVDAFYQTSSVVAEIHEGV